MIFCHIMDDFYLQGILASMKQKKWWIKQDSYTNFYEYDYICALLVHGFSWAFMVTLPLLILTLVYETEYFVSIILINALIHSFIDDLKANRKMINLVTDQIIHLFQIVFMWMIWLLSLM